MSLFRVPRTPAWSAQSVHHGHRVQQSPARRAARTAAPGSEAPGSGAAPTGGIGGLEVLNHDPAPVSQAAVAGNHL